MIFLCFVFKSIPPTDTLNGSVWAEFKLMVWVSSA
jgi:hypothetical protein